MALKYEGVVFEFPFCGRLFLLSFSLIYFTLFYLILSSRYMLNECDLLYATLCHSLSFRQLVNDCDLLYFTLLCVILFFRQLLNDCGIGVDSTKTENGEDVGDEHTIGNHRVLLFCQVLRENLGQKG